MKWNGLKRTLLNRVSAKQKDKNEKWLIIKAAKLNQSKVCQWCGLGEGASELWILDAHHILSRARGGEDSFGNCAILHRACHSIIHSQNIDLAEYPNMDDWRVKNG